MGWSDAPRTVEVPIAMLESMAKMWEELKEDLQQEKEASIASPRLLSASPSTSSLTSVLKSPALLEQLRQLIHESFSQPKQRVCPAHVYVLVAPRLVRVVPRFVSRPVAVTRVRSGVPI